MELGHICGAIDLRLQLSAARIDQFTTIFIDSYATAREPSSYRQPHSNTYWRTYSYDIKYHPYTSPVLIGKYVTKSVRQATQQPAKIRNTI